MLHGRRRIGAGLVLLAAGAAGWLASAAPTAASRAEVAVGASSPTAAITASIAADGTTVGLDPEWFVEKPDAGEYVLTFGRDVRVELASWDLTATVTVRPSTARTWLVDFERDDAPIDTAFSFRAVPLEP